MNVNSDTTSHHCSNWYYYVTLRISTRDMSPKYVSCTLQTILKRNQEKETYRLNKEYEGYICNCEICNPKTY